MTEEINGEQPPKDLGNVQEENVNSGTTSTKEQDGSLGKFKDTESMLKAYNNLQAEFTKKCQKLSETTQELDEVQRRLAETQKKDNTPLYEQEGWQEAVESFLKNNDKAKNYSKEICDEILSDLELAKSPNALPLAWERVMNKNFYSPDMLAESSDFINEKILSKSEVKQQVLNEYFKGLQNTTNPPVIAKSGAVPKVTEVVPKSMAEAKAMVEDLFKLKGN